MEMAVAAALVLAHDADRAEAHLGVTADCLVVGGRRVDRDPVMTALVEQVPGQQRNSLAARALALEPAAEVNVDPRVPVHRVVLLVVLDPPATCSSTSTTKRTDEPPPRRSSSITAI